MSVLVGDAEQQHAGAVQRLGVGVQQLRGAVHHVAGHPAVDLLRQLDEPERVVQLGPHLVGQVVRVDRDAVAADAGAGVERLEAERLGGGAPDRVPQVHAELVAEDRHLVDQRDVHVPVGVLQQLGHLRLARGLGADHGVADLSVEVRRGLGAGRGDAADDLRGVADAVGLVARVDPLRGEREVEADARAQAARLLQHRADDLIGRARVGGGLQDHRAPGAHQRGRRFRGRPHRGQVRAVGLRQRGRHADHDHVRAGRRRSRRRS